jgi:predicted AAA+ superfamily ATPase
VYVRDSGVLHRLLGIADMPGLLSHPKVGASWEGFVIEQILMLDVRNPYFWATHGGAELDLMVEHAGERVGIEVKRTDQPRLTPSIRNALDDLQLDRVIIVHAGKHTFPLADRVNAIPARDVLTGSGLSA